MKHSWSRFKILNHIRSRFLLKIAQNCLAAFLVVITFMILWQYYELLQSQMISNPDAEYKNYIQHHPKKVLKNRGLCISSKRYGKTWIESIYGNSDDLFERMSANVDKNAPPKLILSFPKEITQNNLAGCSNWNCAIVNRNSDIELEKYDAIIVTSSSDLKSDYKPPYQQYIVFYSQESPSYNNVLLNNANFSLNFRRDSPLSSPYGYTVKLAPPSRRQHPVLDKASITNKSLPLIWIVSNCNAKSHREEFVKELQQFMLVNTYGHCGNKFIPYSEEYEKVILSKYYFYLALENSICKDYITEKAWKHGYQNDIIPIVLKRSVIEPYVPPHSFIAVDDFNSTAELAHYMIYLMLNPSVYYEYFKWREDYDVIFLDGKRHDQLETPWGVCQLCRLLWENPRPHHTIENFPAWWSESCNNTWR